MLNNNNPLTYLYTSNIYDDKARVIQVQKQNITGGIDISTTQYTWSGQPYVTVQSQQKANYPNAQTTITISKTTYDALNRPITTENQVSNSLVNGGAFSGYTTVANMQYDGLGQIKVKNLGRQRSGTSYTSAPLETLNYDYNIRGWLLGINRSYVQDVSTASNAWFSGESFTTPNCYCAGQFFGFELGYDKNPAAGNGAGWSNGLQYNGNIAGMLWKSGHDGQIRKYDFNYDQANRLKVADFNQYTGAGFNKNAGVDYSMTIPNYDANGNILQMNQMGLKPNANSSVLIDQLNYTYYSGSNKLKAVTDAVNDNNSTLGDFKYNAGSKTATDYIYDTNGNMTQDNNKGISTITYNYLNLPQTITMTGKGTISYTYDAAGNKLQKKVVDNTNGTTTTTLYLNGVIYQNDVLQFIAHDEGRLRINNTNNGYVYDYFLKDHLGNTRMTITDDYSIATHIIDATSYYPFGLSMKVIGKEAAGGLQNKFKYNGKEEQDELGLNMYDYGARNYEPGIGRWMNIDPKAELLELSSPYVYALNCPIIYIDKDGELPILINGRVLSDSERGNPSYWGTEIINTIKNSGIANPGGQFHYVDGDRGLESFNGKYLVSKNSAVFSSDRKKGGAIQADADWSKILSKLEKDPKTGKIIEKIQIYTHSRGSAFGEGYTEKLLQLINDNSNLFENSSNEIEYIFDMAPHQSSSLYAVKGTNSYTLDHKVDFLSDNDKSGVKAAFTTNEKTKGIGGSHKIGSFVKDIKEFTKAFSLNNTKQSLINAFVKNMKNNYGINVTVKQ